MGADIYIESISNKAVAEHQPHFKALSERLQSLRKGSQEYEHVRNQMSKHLDAMNSEEGYFRDSYNSTSILFALNLNWWNDVEDLLDSEGYMKVPEMIKFRKIISELVLQEFTREQLQENNIKVDDENSPEEWNKYFKEKKERLVIFLTRAIELNEPIWCSI